jgi:ribosomal protein L1
LSVVLIRHTILVHNGDMRAEQKTVRQSVSLPAKVAVQVRAMAKTRRLSATRMLVELIENGIETEKRKQQEFFDLAERFRDEKDPDTAKRLGDQLGRMVFGG